MFGRDVGRTIREQQDQIHALEAEKERLSRLQLSGPAAAIAQTIDENLNKWVDGDYMLDPDTGLPTSDLDNVYDIAIKKAVEQHAGKYYSALNRPSSWN